MRAFGGVVAGLALSLALAACGGAGSPPVQVAPTAAPPAASESPAAAPPASPAGTMDPNAQDDYDYGY